MSERGCEIRYWLVYAESGDVIFGQARASKWHKLKKKSKMCLASYSNSLDFYVERTGYYT